MCMRNAPLKMLNRPRNDGRIDLCKRVTVFIGTLRFTLRIDDAFNIKARRNVVRSLKDRLRPRFNAAIAEISGDEPVYNLAQVGVAVISGEQRHACEQLQHILSFVEKLGEFALEDVKEEIVSI